MKVNKPGSLSFTDYIKKLPSQWVIKHFLKDSEGPRKILSSSMIEDAVRKFSAPEVLCKMYQQLPSGLQYRCAQVYLSGDHGVTLKTSNPFDDPLLLTFLVYAAISNDGTVRIFGFNQFEKHLQLEFVKVLHKTLVVEHVPPPSETFPWRVLNDIATIAGLCFQGSITKKRNGGFNRASMNLLKKLVSTGITLNSKRSEYVYSIAIAYLKKKKLIIETESDYRLVLPAFSMWLTEKVSDRLHEIELFCFEYSGGWNRELILSLFNSNDNWISCRIFPEQDQQDAIDALYALWFGGLIDLQHKGDEVVFSKTKHAEKKSTGKEQEIIVMPNFSTIIPQEIDAAELFYFNELGSLQSFDRVYWGKVSKQVILNSCTRGIDPAQILQRLNNWKAPLNVQETVREWIREFLRLYITDQNMLVSSDEKVTMQINSYAPIRSFLEPVSAHAVFRIKKGSEDKVREILQNLGFDTRMPGQDKSAELIEPMSQDGQTPLTSAWIPITEVEKTVEQTPSPMRGTKYGSELKVLDTSEIVHVIDYAILTGGAVCFDYEGSPYLKQGVYTVKPLSFQKGIDPAFEGEVTRTKSKKMFYLKKIRKIGVTQS